MAISRSLEHAGEYFLDLLEWSRGAASDELYLAMVTVKVSSLQPKTYSKLLIAFGGFKKGVAQKKLSFKIFGKKTKKISPIVFLQVIHRLRNFHLKKKPKNTKMAISRSLEHAGENFLDLLEWSRGAASDEIYRAMVTVKVSPLRPKTYSKLLIAFGGLKKGVAQKKLPFKIF